MKERITLSIVISVLILAIFGVFFGLGQTLSDMSSQAANNAPTSEDIQTDIQTVDTDAATSQYGQLMQQVAPVDGTTVAVQWNDMGQKLIGAGAIDLAQLQSLYNGLSEEQQAILLGNELTEITFTLENIQFWTNVLWALGLTQQSKVLSEGPMQQNVERTPLGNYASTGGWTLGTQPATELYNSAQLIALTPEQDDLVYRVAEGIFRPCCGNHTAYPDCNHGMAVLGLLELMASQGATENDLYKAALAFNSYAFVDSYVRVAAFFSMRDLSWSEVNPRVILGPEYSSGQGAQQVAAAVGPISGTPNQGGSCGV